jgi:hypothetical protein
MMNKRKALILFTAIAAVLILLFDLFFSFYYLVIIHQNPDVKYAHVWHEKYDKYEMIGKTEEEITTKYGAFDKMWGNATETSYSGYPVSYYAAGYLIDPGSGGFYDSQYPVYFNVYFRQDKDGPFKCIGVVIEVISGDKNVFLTRDFRTVDDD